MNFLYENQFIKNDDLIEIIKQTKSLYPYFENSFDGVKPKNYCGFLSIEKQNYFIIPKITDSNNEQNLDIFIYMLLYAYDIKISNEDLANISNTKFKIMEIFIRYFTNGLLSELKKGIYKTYITKEENLKVLKGKYLIEKNFSNFYHQNIHCEFDEFSMDNQLNQFFLYAIKTFQKYSSYSNLHLCEMMLDEVTFNHIDINRLQINFDRLNTRFKKSFEIAFMILQRLSPLVNNSNDKGFVFLFDMAEVFEKFIGKMYQNIDKTAKIQEERNFGNLKLIPDIVTSNMIIDTKYKIIKDRVDLATNDKYQMFTYGVNFGIKNTMLLYPKHFQKDFKDEDLKLGTGDNEVILKMRCIDLMSDGIEYEEYLTKIITRIKNYEK
jgi:5-methylcytosine-specific restriction enzyme subunit McrC